MHSSHQSATECIERLQHMNASRSLFRYFCDNLLLLFVRAYLAQSVETNVNAPPMERLSKLELDLGQALDRVGILEPEDYPWITRLRHLALVAFALSGEQRSGMTTAGELRQVIAAETRLKQSVETSIQDRTRMEKVLSVVKSSLHELESLIILDPANAFV
jgi:hypothetical protein